MEKAIKNTSIRLRGKHPLRVFIAVMLLALFAFPVNAKEPVRIGVLANLGKETAVRMWTPTADYLTASLPAHSFTIVPLSFDEINQAVERKEVDFVLTNPGIYVELEYTYGVTRIATLDTLWKGKEYNSFGGVIFTRADRGDINELRDLKSKAFAAVHETSYGGWRAAFRELKAGGIDPRRHFSRLLFSGESQEQPVFAVRDGKADAGTARTGILERLTKEGRIRLGDFKILNPQKVEGFPLLLSTRLYPEWAFARLRHTRDMIAKKVAAALLGIPADSPAAKAGGIAGFTVPLDYQPVYELMKDLRIGPYKNYGKLTLEDALRKYWYAAVLVIFAAVLSFYFAAYVKKTNVRLEARVKERTALLEREINERKRAEEELSRISEKRKELEFIVNKSRVIAFLWKAEENWPVEFVTENISQFGYAPEDLLSGSLPFAKMVHPEDLERVAREVSHYSQAGADEFVQEYRIVARSGEVRWVNDQTFVRRDNNKITHYQGIVFDITERRRAEEALRENERKYQELVENANSIILRWTRDGVVTFINEYGQDFFGYSEAELLGKNVVGTIVPETDTAGRNLTPLMDEICANPKTFEHNVNENMRRDGSRVWIAWTNKAVLDSQGRVKEVFSVGTDITGRKRAEKALQESEERLRLSTELANVAVWEYSFITNSMSRSNNHDRLYGLAWQATWDINVFLNATHPDDREFSHEVIQKSVAAAGPDQCEFDFRVVYPDQSIHWLMVVGQVVERNAEGQGIIVRGCLVDITGRKRAEEEIRKLNAELEQRVKERTAELENKIAEIERMNKLFVGRELRMVELKEKMSQIEKEIEKLRR